MAPGLSQILAGFAGVVLLLAAVGGVLSGQYLLAGGVVAVAVPLFAFVRAESQTTPAATAWERLPEETDFDPVEDDGDLSERHETRIEDRPVTARVVGGSPKDRGTTPTTIVATPLEVTRVGVGFAVERGEAAPLPDDLAARAEEFVRARGRIAVDDRLGVVRYEVDGTLTNPARLAEAATLVTDVADAVETEIEADAREVGPGVQTHDHRETATEHGRN